MPVFTEESSPEMLQRAAGLKKPPLPRVSSPPPKNTDRTANGAKHEVVIVGVCCLHFLLGKCEHRMISTDIANRLALPESCCR
jgi:hypothetical protein